MWKGLALQSPGIAGYSYALPVRASRWPKDAPVDSVARGEKL